jgi:NTP pyrophosphatase (non-canonical NTP hydrolase)
MNTTDADHELLTILIEECSELIQACSKIKRFGWDTNSAASIGLTNREHLETEIGDLCEVINRLGSNNRLCSGAIERAIAAKHEKLKVFTEYQVDSIAN